MLYSGSLCWYDQLTEYPVELCNEKLEVIKVAERVLLMAETACPVWKPGSQLYLYFTSRSRSEQEEEDGKKKGKAWALRIFACAV